MLLNWGCCDFEVVSNDKKTKYEVYVYVQSVKFDSVTVFGYRFWAAKRLGFIIWLSLAVTTQF